jgi:glucuronoarabinoxylan endo-1,4-beta-xylanase
MKYQHISRTCLLGLALMSFLLACDKEDEAPSGEPALAFVESTLPEGELSAAGGTITLEVDWAFIQWNIKADTALEGGEFIGRIAPTYAGAADEPATRTKVSITFPKNETYTTNKQRLTLKSLSGDINHSIVITQAGKPIEPVMVTINPATTYQTIAGFGGGNTMWGTNFLTPAQIKTAFGTGDNELGLSIFRVRLSSVQSEWSSVVSTLQEAKKYDVKILASPWSPPASLKSNNNVIGGHLLPENYGAYATYLNDFVQHMASEGVTIDAVSLQNEPDWSPNYESCDWTADQIYNFVKNFGGTIGGTKVAAAESFNFKQTYTNTILNDAAAADNLDIVAGHIYGGGLARYPLAEQKGKEIWMTEYLMNLNSGNDPNGWDVSETIRWNESMEMLKSVHDSMNNYWNAYIWWYIRRYYSFLGDGEHGTTPGEVLKRGYAMSQYAKFVRPGYVRIATQTDNSVVQLAATAYKGDHKIVVVMINTENNSIPEVNLVIPETVSSAESYTTSVTLNREKQVLTPVANKTIINVPARSVTTVVLNY